MANAYDLGYGSSYGAAAQGATQAEAARRATLGVNAREVNNALKTLSVEAEKITLTSMKYAQNSIELLMKGWITVSGKERIGIITDKLNDIATKVKKNTDELNEIVKNAAETIAWEGLREKVNITIESPSIQLVNCDGAKDNDNGSAYIIVQFLKDAKSDFETEFKQNAIRACDEMKNAVAMAGLYDNDGTLQVRINSNISALKESIETNINEILNYIQSSIDYQSEEADRAKALGETILSAYNGQL